MIAIPSTSTPPTEIVLPEPAPVVFTPLNELIKVRVVSFGYLWRPAPTDAHLVIDLREVLYNPYHDPAMRQLTGLEPDVRDYVMATPGAMQIVEAAGGMAAVLLPELDRRGKALTIAFGCAGGRHRSVVLANELRQLIAAHGVGVDVTHWDLLRPVADQGGSR